MTRHVTQPSVPSRSDEQVHHQYYSQRHPADGRSARLEANHRATDCSQYVDKILSLVEGGLICSAHDVEHTMRVYRMCRLIGAGLSVDWGVLQISALLHDVARTEEDGDPLRQVDHAERGAEVAGDVLRNLEFPEEAVPQVQHCIRCHRYRNDNVPTTLEAKILFDADKLDGIGAIGLARSLMWLGRNNGRPFERVDMAVYTRANLGDRRNGMVLDPERHSLYAEYETKVRFIGDRLFTDKAREIAESRLRFYRGYLARLEREIDGQA